jgi:hypothetical protein
METVNFSIPKRMILSIINTISIDNFVETETYTKETSLWATNYFDKVFTIEIDDSISKQTALHPDCPPNIEFLTGNSSVCLPNLIPKLKGRRNIYTRSVE